MHRLVSFFAVRVLGLSTQSSDLVIKPTHVHLVCILHVVCVVGVVLLVCWIALSWSASATKLTNAHLSAK